MMAVAFAGCGEDGGDDSEPIKGYSLFQFVNEALVFADNNTNDIVLNAISGFDHISNGYFKEIGYSFWDFVYDNETQNYLIHNILIYYVYDEEPYKEYQYANYVSNASSVQEKKIHGNSTEGLLDSDVIYEIAISDPTIDAFMTNSQKYSNLELFGFQYRQESYLWSINWLYYNGDSHSGVPNAYINIDAEDGSIESVSADGVTNSGKVDDGD